MYMFRPTMRDDMIPQFISILPLIVYFDKFSILFTCVMEIGLFIFTRSTVFVYPNGYRKTEY